MPKEEKGEEAEEVPQKDVQERRGDVHFRVLGSPQVLAALFIFVCVAEADSRAIWPFPQPALRVPDCPCMWQAFASDHLPVLE